MLKAQKAATLEIDDIEAAVAEIMGQLDLESLKTHTIGFVSCLPDFVESGVVAALEEALPFNLVGQTSLATATPQSEDLAQLSLLVLTSDDVEFSLALSSPVTGESSSPLEAAYLEATGGHEEKPVFILSYAPLLTTVSGDFFVNTINAASGGVPLFGTLAADDTMDYSTSQVIYKGQGYRDQLAFVLFYGNVQPRFYLAGITHDKILSETGVVTGSSGSQLQTINNAPVSEFLKDKGLSTNEDGEFVGINSFPYVVDYNDGTDPVIRVMFAITPEGYAVCGGDIPVGATLGVSFFDAKEILESTKTTLEKMAADLAENDTAAILAFSCIGRYFTLGYDITAEADLVHEALDSKGVAYSFTYSGGEMCPSPGKADSAAPANRAHNSTFVAVAL